MYIDIESILIQFEDLQAKVQAKVQAPFCVGSWKQQEIPNFKRILFLL